MARSPDSFFYSLDDFEAGGVVGCQTERKSIGIVPSHTRGGFVEDDRVGYDLALIRDLVGQDQDQAALPKDRVALYRAMLARVSDSQGRSLRLEGIILILSAPLSRPTLSEVLGWVQRMYVARELDNFIAWNIGRPGEAPGDPARTGVLHGNSELVRETLSKFDTIRKDQRKLIDLASSFFNPPTAFHNCYEHFPEVFSESKKNLPKLPTLSRYHGSSKDSQFQRSLGRIRAIISN
jgi:hypothetical protein